MPHQYVVYLQTAFERRAQQNPNYSLRAFARDLKMSPSGLHQVLNGAGGLSALKASLISEKIGLKGLDKQIFLLSVDVAHGRSSQKRVVSKIKLNHLLQTTKAFAPIEIDRFKLIAEWYHLAILELARLDHFVPEAEWIARQLGLTKQLVDESMERLVRLGLASFQNGVFQIESLHNETPYDVPSEAIRSFHSAILALSDEKLKSVSADKREYRTMFISINSDEFIEMKAKIRKFQQEFFDQFEKKGKKDRLYALSFQFFPLHSNHDLS